MNVLSPRRTVGKLDRRQASPDGKTLRPVRWSTPFGAGHHVDESQAPGTRPVDGVGVAYPGGRATRRPVILSMAIRRSQEYGVLHQRRLSRFREATNGRVAETAR